MILLLFLIFLVPVMNIAYYKKMGNIKLLVIMDLLIFVSIILAIYDYTTGGYVAGSYHYSFWVMFPALAGFLIPAVHLQKNIEEYHRENLIEFQPFYVKNGIDVLQLLSDWRVTKLLNTETQHDKEQTQAYCENILEPIIKSEHGNIKRIVNSRGKKLVGLIFYKEIQRNVCDVTMFLFYAQWNQGKGGEAFAKTLNEIKSLNYYKTVQMEVHPENLAMIKILEKNNFVKTNTVTRFKNNEEVEFIIYSLDFLGGTYE